MDVANEPRVEFTGTRRFELVRRLGEGAMGVVYEVLDRERGARVALKTLRRWSADAFLRFKTEFRILQDLHHPNLVSLFELFEEDGRWFFTMELVDGVSFLTFVRTESGRGVGLAPGSGPHPALQTPPTFQTNNSLAAAPQPSFSASNVGSGSGMGTGSGAAPSPSEEFLRESSDTLIWNGRTASLRDSGPNVRAVPRPPPGSLPRSPGPRVFFNEKRLREALAQLGRGLCALHAAGNVHRDIKPSNVMVTREGRVVILDFGLISEVSGDVLGPQRRRVGSPSHMAPEQASTSTTDPAADWYSVGVLLYQALTGLLPFTGDSEEVIRRKQTSEPVPPQMVAYGVPPDLAELTLDLLRRDPRARPSGPQVLERLRAAEPLATPLAAPLVGGSLVGGMVGGVAGGMGGGPVEFIGREREFGFLRSAFLDVRTGQTVTVLVHGASGVGKSALVRHFTERLGTGREALVFLGRCYERESVPYKAVDGAIDALSRYLVRVTPDSLQEILPRDRGLLGAVFPVMRRIPEVAQAERPALGGMDAHELRKRLFAALRELLLRLGRRHPVVLALDDLQWADADSLALLGELVRPPRAPQLLVLATMRPGLEGTGEGPASDGHGTLSLAEVAASLPGSCDIRQLKIEGLPPAEAQALAEALARRAGARGVKLDAIASEARGHPLFIDELVRYHLMAGEASLERGADGVPGDGSSGDGVSGDGAPPGRPLRLDDALWARIQRLDASAREVLELLAVAGTPLRQEVVSATAGCEFAEFGQRMEHLRGQNLVKTTGARRRDTVEPYHDRVREAVLAHLPADGTREWHRRLALVLEASQAADAEALAIHWRAYGDRARAAAYAARAAREADQALAFDRAARLYRMALELGPAHIEERRQLMASLGDALANAGRGGEAAGAYLSAAAAAAAAATAMAGSATSAPADAAAAAAAPAPPALILDLRRRAAEQLLRSGRIDEGLEVLGSVLAAVGLKLPATPRRALAALLVRRARVRLRGLGFREREAAVIPPEALQRIDVCWSVAAALGLVDPIRGRYFEACGLIYALDAGEPHRVARALAVEASYSAMTGGAGKERTAERVAAAAKLADRIGHPYALAWAQAAAGITAALEGRWREGYAHCDQAETMFRERCTGVAWEQATAHWFALWSLVYLGRLGELVQSVPERLREAAERGDLYATIAHATGLPNMIWLASGDPEEARRRTEEAMGRWSRQTFQVAHWWHLLAETQIDLYQGEGAQALERMHGAWPQLKASLLLQVQLTRLEAWHLRARAALRAAEVVQGSARADLLETVERDAGRMERERMPWSDPLVILLKAAVAATRGRPERAQELLADAATGCETVGMALYAAAARHRQGELLGGDEGWTLVREAATWMRGQGVIDPGRMVAMLAPGFGRST